MNWEMILWIAGGLMLAPHLWDAVYRRVRVAQADAVKLAQLRAESLRHIPNDDHGRGGLVVFGDAKHPVVRNMDAGYAVTSNGVIDMDELAARVDAQQKLLLALADRAGIKDIPELLETVSESEASLPEFIGPERVFGRRHTIENLLIGYRVGEHGLEPVESSIFDLMHVLEVGSSGWGKSSWLRLLIYQLAQAQENVDIVAIDPSGSEFNVLKNWNRLQWPVAKTIEEAVSQLEQVSIEIGRRRDLYAETTATSIGEYNAYAAQSGGKELAPMVLLVDEGTHLLNQSGTQEPLREVVQTGRQYGMFGVLAGQSANHKVIPTQTRDQFSTKVCFRVPPNSSRVVLGTSDAANLNAKGRALVIRPGEPMCEIQAPYIDRNTFTKTLANHSGPPAKPAPTSPVTVYSGPTDEQIIECYERVGSFRQVELELFGYTGGRAHERVRAAIKGE